MHIDEMEEDENSNPGMNVLTRGEDPEKTQGNRELIKDNHSAIQEGGEIQKRVSRKLVPL